MHRLVMACCLLAWLPLAADDAPEAPKKYIHFLFRLFVTVLTGNFNAPGPGCGCARGIPGQSPGFSKFVPCSRIGFIQLDGLFQVSCSISQVILPDQNAGQCEPQQGAVMT